MTIKYSKRCRTTNSCFIGQNVAWFFSTYSILSDQFKQLLLSLLFNLFGTSISSSIFDIVEKYSTVDQWIIPTVLCLLFNPPQGSIRYLKAGFNSFKAIVQREKSKRLYYTKAEGGSHSLVATEG